MESKLHIHDKSIAVVGGQGLLGSELVRHFSSGNEVAAIDRENYADFAGQRFDILINANGNSKRFWANQNPRADFEASTLSVFRTFLDFTASRYIYISSSDVYADHSRPETTSEDRIIEPEKLSPYGLHKYLSEQIVRHWVKDYLILRSSMILGPGLKKGPFYDIQHGGSLFVTTDSRLQIITAQEVAAVADFLLNQPATNQIFNVGGRGTFDLAKIGNYFSAPATFSPEAETQVYEMNVTKLAIQYPLCASEEYLQEYLKSF